MQLLASSIFLAMLAHVPGSSGSPTVLRRISLFNSTLRPLNSTLPLLNLTVSAENSATLTATSTATSTTVSTTAPPPIRTLPPVWNIGNNTCNDFTTMTPAEQYLAVSGDLVVANMSGAYMFNFLLCPECGGKTKDKCQSTSPSCRNGLRDLSEDGGDTPRWDTAAARFAANPDLTDLRCGIGHNGCGGGINCASCNGPGSFALLKSMSTLSNKLNDYYNAVRTASQSATNQMAQFSAVFAPVPQPKDDSFANLFKSILGAAIGLIPGVGGEIAGAMHEIGTTLIDTVNKPTESSPADTSTVLGVITDSVLHAWQDFSDQMFQNGVWQAPDGVHALSFQKIATNGALMGNGTDFSALVPLYGKILFQQLAMYTWLNLESGSQQHMPFIAFDNAECDKVDPNHSVVQGAPGLDAGYTYKGACYYLLDALPVTKQQFSGRTFTDIQICKGGNALPGCTNKSFREHDALFAGVSLADFVVPAVEGWLANGKQNGYPSIADDPKKFNDPQAPGAVVIPVCDYAANSKDGGKGCPKLDQRQGSHEKCDTT